MSELWPVGLLFIFSGLSFFSIVASGSLHFYSNFCVNALAGVEILV